MNRIMALDVGKVRVGVAISDPTNTISSPLETVKRGRSPEKCFIRIMELINEKKVNQLVAGLPMTLSNKEELAAQHTREFIDLLQVFLHNNNIDLPLEFVDERMTTALSERFLLEADLSRKKRRGVIDKVAACEILRTYLSKKKALL